MGILLDENSRILVQGITGREGSFHARAGMAYGTSVVAGVTPGRGGQMFEETVPVFNSVEEAVAETGANVSLIFVPPPFAPDAIVEAADSGIAPHRLHYRGCSGAGHGQGRPLPGAQVRCPAHRPQLSLA